MPRKLHHRVDGHPSSPLPPHPHVWHPHITLMSGTPSATPQLPTATQFLRVAPSATPRETVSGDGRNVNRASLGPKSVQQTTTAGAQRFQEQLNGHRVGA